VIIQRTYNTAQNDAVAAEPFASNKLIKNVTVHLLKNAIENHNGNCNTYTNNSLETVTPTNEIR